MSQSSKENTCASLRPSGLQLYEKEIPAKVFMCEFFKIYKNTFLTEHLRGTTSVFSTQLLLDPQIGKHCFSGLKCCQLIEYFRDNSCHLRSLASLHKKWSFPFRISSVNVTKSAGNSLLWRNP